MYDIYSSAHNDEWRFALGKRGSRQVLIIGLNPSIATQDKSDTTAAKVERVARRNGFDGFVMLNLYPVRATDFRELPADADLEAFAENLKRVEALAGAQPDPVVWAAWGNGIRARSYFAAAANELFTRLEKYGARWWHFGPLTRLGHPRHPSRTSYAWEFSRLDTRHYELTLGMQRFCSGDHLHG